MEPTRPVVRSDLAIVSQSAPGCPTQARHVRFPEVGSRARVRADRDLASERRRDTGAAIRDVVLRGPAIEGD